MDEFVVHINTLQLTQKDFLIRLLLTIGIGFLIGLEREHSAMISKEKSFAGVRTFIIIVLSGFIGALMYHMFSPWIYVCFIIAMISFIGISYWSTSSTGDIGGTTEFTAFISFFLGSLTLMGFIEISISVTLIILVVLSAKIRLLRMIGKITQEEMYAIIRYVVSAIVIIPFLPDINIGPYQILNPREIGWIVLLTSGLGFLGYLLMKFLGNSKGILFTGLVGGLVSSTMTAWMFAKKSSETPSLSAHCATAILAASSVMVFRVLFLVVIFNQSLAPHLYLPLTIVLLSAIVCSVYFHLHEKEQPAPDTQIRRGKPLQLQNALLFACIFIGILLLVSYANEIAGNKGILFTSAIAGLSDIDAITISVCKLSGVSLSTLSAQNAILIAILSNTLVKTGIVIWAGSKALKRYILIGFGSVFIASMIAFLILNF